MDSLPQRYHDDFPFLTWLQLLSKNPGSNILTRPVHKKMWQVHPTKSNLHSVNPRVFGKFKDKLKDVKAAVLNPFHDIITDTCFSCIHALKIAYSRAFKALDRLEKESGAWRDFVKVAMGLQRSLLELIAFVD